MLTNILIILLAVMFLVAVFAAIATWCHVAPWSDRYPDDDNYDDDDDDDDDDDLTSWPPEDKSYDAWYNQPDSVLARQITSEQLKPSGWLRGIRSVFAQIGSTSYPVTDDDDNELYPPLPDDAPYNVFQRVHHIVYSELDPAYIEYGDATDYTREHVAKLNAMAADVEAFMSHQDAETALYISEMRLAA